MGIIAWGAYLPTWRLSRRAIADALGSGGGAGTRSVASYDEDTTTMAVEAGRRALAALAARGEDGAEGDRLRPSSLWFSTPSPAYVDKTNATVIHQALDLPAFAAAFDQCGSVRSAEGAMRAAGGGGRLGHDRHGGADRPPHRPRRFRGRARRRRRRGRLRVRRCRRPIGGGRGAGPSSITAEFLDRWRTPGEPDSRQWEERFGEEVYVPLVEPALADALKSAGLDGGRGRPRHRGRAARPGGGSGHRCRGRPARGRRRRARRLRRQPGRRPGGPPAGRRARPGRARRGDRRDVASPTART